MQGWLTSYLGLRDLPRELSEFELQAFFSFGRNELEVIARRRGDNQHRAWVRPGVRSSPMPTGSAPSERWRWPPCSRCVARYATARSGSSTP